MPKLLSYIQTPTHASSTALSSSALPPNWLQQIPELIAAQQNLSADEKEKLIANFEKHVGPASTYSNKQNLIESLQYIYTKITDPALAEDIKASVYYKLCEDIDACTPGWNVRVADVIQSFNQTHTLIDIAALYRHSLVMTYAAQIVSQIPAGSQVHFYNDVFRVAQHFGLPPIFEADIYHSGVDPDVIYAHLVDVFDNKYQFFQLMKFIHEHLKTEFSILGYEGDKTHAEPPYYTPAICEKLMDFIAQIVKDAPELTDYHKQKLEYQELDHQKEQRLKDMMNHTIADIRRSPELSLLFSSDDNIAHYLVSDDLEIDNPELIAIKLRYQELALKIEKDFEHQKLPLDEGLRSIRERFFVYSDPEDKYCPIDLNWSEINLTLLSCLKEEKHFDFLSKEEQLIKLLLISDIPAKRLETFLDESSECLLGLFQNFEEVNQFFQLFPQIPEEKSSLVLARVLPYLHIPRTQEIAEPILMYLAKFPQEIQSNYLSVLGGGDYPNVLFYALEHKPEVFDALLEKINPHDLRMLQATNSQGQTLLHLAARLGAVKSIEKLIRLDLDLDAKDLHENTPLMLAIQHKKEDMVSLLLSLDVNPNELFYILSQHPEAFDDLLDKIDPSDPVIHARDGYGQTLLHLAARLGAVKSIEKLISLGLNLEVTDSCQNTPLMTAVINNQVGSTAILLDKGANFETRNDLDKTPLMIACQYHPDTTDLVKLLLSKDPDMTVRSKITQRNALDYSLYNTSSAYLLDHMITLTIDKQAKCLAKITDDESPYRHGLHFMFARRPYHFIYRIRVALSDPNSSNCLPLILDTLKNANHGSQGWRTFQRKISEIMNEELDWPAIFHSLGQRNSTDLNHLMEMIKLIGDPFKKQFLDACLKQLPIELDKSPVSAAAVESLISAISSLTSPAVEDKIFQSTLSSISNQESKYSIFTQALKIHQLNRLIKQLSHKTETDPLMKELYRELNQDLETYHNSVRSSDNFQQLKESWQEKLADIIPKLATKSRCFGFFKPEGAHLIIKMQEQITREDRVPHPSIPKK